MYQIIFHEVDPLDVIPDISAQAWALNGVKAEVYSKVERNQFNKYHFEFDISEETTYVESLSNDED